MRCDSRNEPRHGRLYLLLTHGATGSSQSVPEPTSPAAEAPEEEMAIAGSAPVQKLSAELTDLRGMPAKAATGLPTVTADTRERQPGERAGQEVTQRQ